MKPPRIGSVQRPCRGEQVCGDVFVILEGNPMIVAVADGLGHGPQAEHAAARFCEFIRAHPASDVVDLMRRASNHIVGTRGVAAALICVDLEERALAFTGIGNIEMQSVSQAEIRPASTPGIAGRPLRKVIQFNYKLAPGDLLAMYTDGISSRFSLSTYENLEVQAMADRILAECGKEHDDATCITMRF